MKYIIFAFFVIFPVTGKAVDILSAPAFSYFDFEGEKENIDFVSGLVRVFSADGALLYERAGSSEKLVAVLDDLLAGKYDTSKKLSPDYPALRKKLLLSSIEVPPLDPLKGEFQLFVLSVEVEFPPSVCEFCAIHRTNMETIDKKYGKRVKVLILELELP